jgi:hypothetical protein
MSKISDADFVFSSYNNDHDNDNDYDHYNFNDNHSSDDNTRKWKWKWMSVPLHLSTNLDALQLSSLYVRTSPTNILLPMHVRRWMFQQLLWRKWWRI